MGNTNRFWPKVVSGGCEDAVEGLLQSWVSFKELVEPFVVISCQLWCKRSKDGWVDENENASDEDIQRGIFQLTGSKPSNPPKDLQVVEPVHHFSCLSSVPQIHGFCLTPTVGDSRPKGSEVATSFIITIAIGIELRTGILKCNPGFLLNI